MANIIRHDPFAGLTNLHSQLDDMFNSMFNNWPTFQTAPAMDLYTEDDKELVAEIHLPGYTKNNIEISVNNDVLEIKGARAEKAETDKKKRNYMMRESSTRFYRSIALPKNADGEAVQAHFSDGVLKVRVPFKIQPTPKKIVISDSKK